MTTSPLRRTAAALTALLTSSAALLAVAAPPAAAAPAVRGEALYSAVADVEVPTPDGLVVLDAYLGTSRGTVALYDDARTAQRAVTGEDFAVTVTSDAVTGSGPLYDPLTGAPVGTASYDLALTRLETEVVRHHRGTGNDAERETQTATRLRATGTVTVLGASHPVDAVGVEVRYAFFDNAPAAEAGSDASGRLSAAVPGDDGSVLLLEAGSDEISALVLDAGGDVRAFAVGHHGTRVLHSDGLHGVLYVDDLSGAGPVERTVDVPGTLDRTKVRTVEQRPAGEVHLTTQRLALHGVLELGPGLAFDLDGVEGTWTQYRWVHQRSGA